MNETNFHTHIIELKALILNLNYFFFNNTNLKNYQIHKINKD